MQSSVYELHAANAASRLDQLMGYAGPGLRRVLMIANDDFLTVEAGRRGLEVTSMSSTQVEAGALATLTSEPFDAAIFYCTLERLTDPDEMLKDVRRRLTPSGVVMVIAPTIDSRTARLFRSAWWEFNAANRHYFSADTLQALLLKCGFGDPIIDTDDCAVSLEYFRAKIPAVSSACLRRGLKWLVYATPPFLRRRAFRSLNSRRVFLVRSKPVVSLPTLSVIVPAYNEKNTLSPDGPPARQVDRRRGHRDRARRKQFLGWHARRCDPLWPTSASAPDPAGQASRQGLCGQRGPLGMHRRPRPDSGRRPRVRHRRLRRSHRALAGVSSQFRDRLETCLERSMWKIRQFNESARLAAVFNFGHVVLPRPVQLHLPAAAQDPFSMFKVFRRECLYGLTFECNRFDFDFEIVIKLLRKGYQPIELPVNYRARSPNEGKESVDDPRPADLDPGPVEVPLGSVCTRQSSMTAIRGSFLFGCRPTRASGVEANIERPSRIGWVSRAIHWKTTTPGSCSQPRSESMLDTAPESTRSRREDDSGPETSRHPMRPVELWIPASHIASRWP